MAVIVVADDDQDVADLITYAFERAGHTVRTVLDGTKALHLIQALLPDLVVLDHDMPGLTGSAIASALRANPSTVGTTVVMITGQDVAEAAGLVDRILVKPVGPRQLIAIVAEMLDISAPAPSADHDGRW